MYKRIVFTFSVQLLSFSLYAQTMDITSVLQQVEQNNKELQAYSSLIDSRKLALKSGNNLPDPQAGAYYMPWGDHTGGDYTEFEISQTFEFPTVYGARSSLIKTQQEQMQLDYAVKRRDILLEAKKHCQEVIYLNRMLEVEQSRTEQAKKVFDQVQQLYDKGEVGILVLNKAKISWMQAQFKIEQIENDKKSLLLLLKNLNGGNEIAFDQSQYSDSLGLAKMDTLWSDKLSNDPELKNIRQQEEVALQQIKLYKNKSLPDLTAGFNHQGVNGSYYSGLYAGLSIPLWNNRNKVKAAESNYVFQQSYTSARSLEAETAFEKQYNEYHILLNKFREYQSTLSDLNSEQLLFRSYELGQISFIEYYMELQFYRQAYDTMLGMEKQLNQLKADILKHQL